MSIYQIAGVIAGISILVLLLWNWRQRTNPRSQLRAAETAFGKGNTAAAEALFRRAIVLVDKGKAKSDEKNEILSKSYFAIAEIEQGRGNNVKAVAYYQTAKDCGASLPVAAVLLLAEHYAKTAETGEVAIDAYLTYLVSGPKNGPEAEKVYASLQSLCQVTEDLKPAQRKLAVELNRRVIATDAKLEWAYYFFALANLLEGRTTEAIVAFGSAKDLNPDRALTYYWLAVCHLQMPAPSIDDAIAMVERFFSFAQHDSRTRKREARVCTEIARRLVDTIGGFNAGEVSLKDQALANLDRAIRYLEVAVEREPESASEQYDLGRAYRLKGDRTRAITCFQQATTLAPREKLYAYDLGMEYLKSGQSALAIESLAQAVQISPSYEEAHDALGGIHFDRGDYENAVGHLSAALASGKRNPQRLGMLVQSLYTQGQFVQVTEELDRRKADPSPLMNDMSAAYAAGRSYSAIGRFEDAINWLNQVTDRQEATYFLGCMHANLNRFAEAAACFDLLSGAENEWAKRAELQRCHMLYIQGDRDAATKSYRHIVEADAANFEALQALGSLALEGSNISEAVSMFSAAAAIRPDESEARFALGLALERKGDMDEALLNYEAAVRAGAESVSLLRIGVIRCRLGDFDEAVKMFDLSAQSGTLTDTLCYYRGLASALLGRNEDAIQDWIRLGQRHPENERLKLNLSRARYVLGAQYLSHGKTEEAIHQWELYLTECPMDGAAARDLGELQFRMALESLQTEDAQALFRARECLEAALLHDPNNETFRFYSALCDARSGPDLEGAIGALRGLAEENGQAPHILYHLGWCLLQNGNPDEAAQFFEQVRSLAKADGYRRQASWALSNLLIESGKFQEAAELLMSTAVLGNNTLSEVQP